MSHRRIRKSRARRCPCGKTAYRTYEIAAGVAGRNPVPGRVYYGPCGGWHITRDYDEEKVR